jgi:hypothetical protein
VHKLFFARLSNSITSDNRDPNNALNSDMGVVWGTSVFASKHNQTSFNICSGFFCKIFLSGDLFRLWKLGIF